MQGELVAEFSGKLSGMRVLSSDPQNMKLEVSVQGSGTVLGSAVTDMWTYWQTLRPGGIFYGEGEGLWMSAGGDIVSCKGAGVGHPTGPGYAARFSGPMFFQTTAAAFARLNGVAGVYEYDVDEGGSYRYRVWEWKTAPVPVPAAAR